MADIKLISALRERTGAGLADCKAVLEEANDDIELAIDLLRKKGGIKAAKKADRESNEGVIAIARDENGVAVVALRCETDFVARNEGYIATVQSFADKLLGMDAEEFKTWAEQNIKDELIIKIGENLQLATVDKVSGAVVGSYVHSNRKIAAVVALSGGTQELANDIALHISAMTPLYLAPADVPAEEIEKEKDIYRTLLKQDGKPEEMWDKIMEGKLNKYYEEVCLLNQVFVKDDSQKISGLIGENKIVSFKRYSI